jgi:hypothetical protein
MLLFRRGGLLARQHQIGQLQVRPYAIESGVEGDLETPADCASGQRDLASQDWNWVSSDWAWAWAERNKMAES